MCIRDRVEQAQEALAEADLVLLLVEYLPDLEIGKGDRYLLCLLYTSDAADDLLCVDLGGRRLIKKKN